MPTTNLLAWSKHTSCFSVLGSDVRVYELVRGKPSLVSICSEIQQGRCVDFAHDPHQPLLAAVGTMSGGIACCNFATQSSHIDKILLQRRSHEQCNAVAWNPKKWHHLVAGLDKGSQKRGSTMIFDISQLATANNRNNRNQSGLIGSQQRDVYTKPLRLFSDTEGTASLAWKPDDPSCLVVGSTSKWLRAYDTRSNSNSPVVSISAHNQSVMGLAFSECQPNMLLTYSDHSIVKVWDMRTIIGGTSVATVDTKEKDFNAKRKAALSNQKNTKISNKDNTSYGGNHYARVGKQQSADSLVGILSVAGIIEGNVNRGRTGGGKLGAGQGRGGINGTYGFGNDSGSFNNRQSGNNGNNGSGGVTQHGGLVDVRWSPKHNYQFATASANSDCIKLWNIAHGTAAVARQRGQSIGSLLDHRQSDGLSEHNGMTPIRRRFVSSKIISFVFQRDNDDSRPTVERVLVATEGGRLEDITMYDHMPLTINLHGNLTWGGEKKVVSIIKRKGDNQNKMQSAPMKSDTMDEMASRAKAGYSLNAAKNVEMLESTHRTSINSTRGLIDAWCSVDRAISIKKESVLRKGLTATLTSSSNNEASTSDTKQVREVLGFKTYLSRNRITALRLCGWLVTEYQEEVTMRDGKDNGVGRSSRANNGSFSPEKNNKNMPRAGSFENRSSSLSSSSSTRLSEIELRQYITQMSNRGSRCRAAALAAFHGNISISVDVLQKAAAESAKGSVAYELLSLVTMTVAGFPVESRDPNGSQKIWRDVANDLCGKLWEAAIAQKGGTTIVNQAESLKNDSTGGSSDPRTLSSRSILYLRVLLCFLCSPPGWIAARMKRGLGTKTYFRKIDKEKVLGGSSSDNNGDSQTDTTFNGYEGLLDPSSAFDYEGTGIRICDQVGFACLYLPDNALERYLKILTVEVIARGDVAGLLLTGCGPNACPMFQQYIDNTNDLQSVVLLSCSIGMTNDQINDNDQNIKNNKKFQEWIHLYREFLNRHQLWLIRAKFDVARSKKVKILKKQMKKEIYRRKMAASLIDSKSDASLIGARSIAKEVDATLSLSEQEAILSLQRPQVAARCNHCKASFQLSDLLADASIKRSDWLAKQPAKMLSCPLPKCKKALPRCSICLLPMTVQNPFLYLGNNNSNNNNNTTTTSGSNSNNYYNIKDDDDDDVTDEKRSRKKKNGTSWEATNPYSEWFVWCNSCHHGGHTQCLSNWFSRHPKCPVSNCKCNCSMLDTF